MPIVPVPRQFFSGQSRITDDTVRSLRSILNELIAAVNTGTGVSLFDLQGRIPNVTFSFNGATPPVPGTFPGQFGICHTTGGLYTQGQVVYDDGNDILIISPDVARTITTQSAVSGGISLIANGVYGLESGLWVLKGDGGGSSIYGVTPDLIPESTVFTIPENHQMILHDNITIDGELIIDGQLVVF